MSDLLVQADASGRPQERRQLFTWYEKGAYVATCAAADLYMGIHPEFNPTPINTRKHGFSDEVYADLAKYFFSVDKLIDVPMFPRTDLFINTNFIGAIWRLNDHRKLSRLEIADILREIGY